MPSPTLVAEPAFAAAFDAHFSALHGYLRRRAGDAAGEELAAETFMRAYDARASFDPDRGSVRAWLFGIAVHLLQGHERSTARQRRAYARAAPREGDADDADATIDRLDAAEQDRSVGEALAALRAERREVLLLTAWAELSYEERTGYLATVGDEPPYSAITPKTASSWIGRDGSVPRDERPSGPVRFGGPRDRARWVADGRPPLTHPAPSSDSFGSQGFPFGRRALSYAALAALPTDPDRLYAALIEGAGDGGSSPDAEAFDMVGSLLRSAPVPPEIRAALYRATAKIKGVRFAGEIRDPLGRPGLAVELVDGAQTQQLVFDPATLALLAEQDVLRERQRWIDADPGTLIGSRVVVEQAIVDAVGDRP